jgi:hypothetical protein
MKHKINVHVMHKLHELEVLKTAQAGVKEMIDDAVNDLRDAYEPEIRDAIGTQISVLYAVHDTIEANLKSSKYIWN